MPLKDCPSTSYLVVMNYGAVTNLLPTKSVQSSVADFLVRQLPYSLREAKDFYGMKCLSMASLSTQAVQKIDIISNHFVIVENDVVWPVMHICTKGGSPDVFKYIGEVVPGITSSPFVHILAPFMLAHIKEPNMFQYVFTMRYGRSLFHRAIRDGSLRKLKEVVHQVFKSSEQD